MTSVGCPAQNNGRIHDPKHFCSALKDENNTCVSVGAGKRFMMFIADITDVTHENMGNGALFSVGDNL